MNSDNSKCAGNDETELCILSAGAAKEIVTKLAKLYIQTTGHGVTLNFAPVGAIRERILSGETADLIVVAAPVLEELVQQGKVNRKTIRQIGKVGVGIAVQSGQTLPDISTADILRATLLNAQSLVYADPASGASSGIQFAKVLQQLGIEGSVRGKSILLPGGGSAIMETVAAGQAQIGIQQITEILPVQGVDLVGPLPAELQQITMYSAGIFVASTLHEQAEILLSFLSCPAVIRFLHSAGFELD